MRPRSDKNSKSRILVVDDHPLFREGLVRVLNKEKDLEVCGEAPDASEALKQYAALKPDMAIVDISLEGMNGLELTRQLRDRDKDLRILVVSMHKESMHAERALKAGANGYIMKREDGEKLLEAIREVLSGRVYVSRAMSDVLLQKMSQGKKSVGTSPIENLSNRELEIFEMMGQGYGSRQIADQLNISIKTVETHRERIRVKLNITTTVELVQQAIHWMHHETPPQ